MNGRRSWWRKFLSPGSWYHAASHFAQIVGEFPRDVAVLGWQPAWVLLRVDVEHWVRRVFQPSRLKDAPQSLVTIHLRGFSAPIVIRRNTSDRFIVRQIFREKEYGRISLKEPIRRFVDAGANIGCASFYLLHQYPDAEADVVEPDPENLAVCRRNLAPFASRVRFHGTGVWSRSTPLKLIRPAAGEALESTIHVQECSSDDEPDVVAISMDDLRSVGNPQEFDLVKMDIEGAERELFEAPSLHWLDATRNLMVELHGPEARRAFDRVLDLYDSHVAWVGDVTICTDLVRKREQV